MAASTTSSRSGGFFKLYLFIWVVASAAALAYLASLLTGPDLSRALQQQAQGEPEQSTRLASRALSEVGNVRRSVSEIQRDVGQIREGLEQRDNNDRQTQSRLSALEERVSGMNAPVASNTQGPAAKQKAVEKSDKKAKDKTADRSTSRLSRLENEEEKDPFERPEAERVETGSIVPPAQPAPPAAAPTITFGAPVVTPTKSSTTYAVQIGAGNSREAVRSSWNQLTNKHAALQGLEPRVVAPKAEGGKFRLMAGPFPSKAEAERVCADMGVGRTGCFSTTFGGEPL